MIAQSTVRPPFVCLFLFIILVAIPLPTLAQYWEFIGPYTGGVEEFWPSPLDPNLIFIRGQLDGSDPDESITMVSDDGGVTFETTYIIRELYEVVFHPSDPLTIYGLYEDQFVTSRDGGHSWFAITLEAHGGPETGRFLTKQPDSSDVFYVMGAGDYSYGRDLYVSGDEGQTWTQLYTTPPGIVNEMMELAMDPHVTGRLFALKRGTSWEPYSSQLMLWDPLEHTWDVAYDSMLTKVSDLRFNPVQPGTMYLHSNSGSFQSRTLVSTGINQPWEPLEGPWSGDLYNRMSILSDGTVAVITRDGMYAQNNPGPDWWQVTSFDPQLVQLPRMLPSQFYVHPASMDQVYGIFKDDYSGNLFLRSVDGGGTWSMDTHGLTCPGAVSVQVCRADPQTLLADAGNALYLSNDQGASWRMIESDVYVTGYLHPADPNFIVSISHSRSGDDQIPLRYTSDGGANWTSVETLEYISSIAFHPDHPGVGWMDGYRTAEFNFYKFSDMFTTLVPGYFFEDGIGDIYPDPVFDDHLYATSSYGLFLSTDGGDTFDQIDDQYNYKYISLQPDGIAMTMYTTDTYSGYYSPDRNASFGEALNIPYAIYQLMITYNGDLLYHGNNFKLYLSEDQGDSWTELLDADQEIMNVTAHADRTIYAATQHNGIWMLPNGLAVDEPGIVSLTPAEFRLGPAYPNPFNAMTTFTLSLPHPGAVNVAVFDILGRQVASLADGKNYAAGRHQLAWSASAAASGVYLIRATNTAGAEGTIRVTLVK